MTSFYSIMRHKLIKQMFYNLLELDKTNHFGYLLSKKHGLKFREIMFLLIKVWLEMELDYWQELQFSEINLIKNMIMIKIIWYFCKFTNLYKIITFVQYKQMEVQIKQKIFTIFQMAMPILLYQLFISNMKMKLLLINYIW